MTESLAKVKLLRYQNETMWFNNTVRMRHQKTKHIGATAISGSCFRMSSSPATLRLWFSENYLSTSKAILRLEIANCNLKISSGTIASKDHLHERSH